MDLEKTNAAGYLKDKRTGAIINTNLDQYVAYQHGKQRTKEVIALRRDYDHLKNELDVIKHAIGLKGN